MSACTTLTAALLGGAPANVSAFAGHIADAVGCHIITATNDVLKRLSPVGKGISQFSIKTVEMFYSDAVAPRFRVPSPEPRA
jgi:hypothetical protein